ncbi:MULTISPECIES: hypothetical protein [unclassified Thioalkalivibrio]|uniref:hypothetical protein n=1 Tax=unclassified Thioalkalivibrio TaxID=2621013 RepID=UPI00037019E6|nr:MULTISPECIES: hypothetical protein [unclassified Thioalkalivibrio]
MNNLDPITYADTAYTAEQAHWPRPEPDQRSRRFRMTAASGQQLPRRCPTVDLFPMNELQKLPPRKLREFEAEIAEEPEGNTPRPKERPNHPIRWDEECLRHTSLSRLNFIVGFIRLLGWAGVVGVTPIMALASVLAIFLLYDPQEVENFWSHATTFFYWEITFWAAVVSPVLWGGANLIYRLFPSVGGLQRGPQWELNRRTGNVIVYDNPRRRKTAWKILHERPFREFDCHLQSTPSHQGLPQYTLSLVHYSQDIHVPIAGMFGATGHVDQRAAWDMIQRFMDTSQPLPDTPMWEKFRPLDPTTLEHDRQTGRPPRYWRDMDDETFSQVLHEHQDRLNMHYRR